MATPDQLSKIATRLRIHCLRMTTAAGSGHPTSCLSCAEIMAVLFFHEMKFNVANPHDFGNDEFVLSKGHAAPILWSALSEAGIVPPQELANLRKITSTLEGHPTPRMPWAKVATGSLGQGLAASCGMAWALRYAKSPARVYCLLGDSECAEGSVWEAANLAAGQKLRNLVAIIDMNRLGQTGPTMHEHNADAYKKKFEAFGWTTTIINGHSISAIKKALEAARTSENPVAIIAKTIKGKGVSFLENKTGWHGKACNQQELELALKEIGPLPKMDASKLVSRRPSIKQPPYSWKGAFAPSTYEKPAATRDGFGKALVKIGALNTGIIAIDAEVRNSTREEWFFEHYPDRSVNCSIAEQAMVGFSMGLAAKGLTPFPSSFACFLTRAADFIRMTGLSRLNIKLVGSHSGVSIGEDGPSQMGLEDFSLFRPVPGCIVLSPSDAVSAEWCTLLLAKHQGMGYMRTARMETPIIYKPREPFAIGGSKVLCKSPKDKVTVIATGITVHESLTAHDELQKEGISIRVIDAYSIQPIDKTTILKAAQATKGNVIVVEDHYEAGGLGEAVASVLCTKTGGARLPEKGTSSRRVIPSLKAKPVLHHLCIREAPRSGKPRELIGRYGISTTEIEKVARRIVRG